MLSKLGIDDLILENAFAIIDADNSGHLERHEFIGILDKMIHPPAVEDLLMVSKKLDWMLADFTERLRRVESEIPRAVTEAVTDMVEQIKSQNIT